MIDIVHNNISRTARTNFGRISVVLEPIAPKRYTTIVHNYKEGVLTCGQQILVHCTELCLMVMCSRRDSNFFKLLCNT